MRRDDWIDVRRTMRGRETRGDRDGEQRDEGCDHGRAIAWRELRQISREQRCRCNQRDQANRHVAPESFEPCRLVQMGDPARHIRAPSAV
jgi:hypothetical protein